MTYEERAEQAILNDLLRCNPCTDISQPIYIPEDDNEKIRYYERHLPLVAYVRDQAVNFIFSNGVTTGEEESNNRLQDFLYRKNRNGITNYDVFKDSVRNALWEGECGLRNYEGDLYMVKRGYFAILTRIVDGIEFTVGYLVREDGKEINKSTIQLKKDYQTIQEIYERFSENKLILLGFDDFVNLRNSTAYLHGDPPPLRDEERLRLLLSEYQHLNHDLDFDGPGRILLHVDSVVTASELAPTSEIVNQSQGAVTTRNENAIREGKRLAKEIKNSGSDAVIVVSGAFRDKVTHLPRVTKSTDDFFREWIRNEGVIIAQDIGISPALIELGDVSGNVSMEKIIDNDIENTVIPLRENYATQASDLISRMADVPKVYFDKYKLKQVEDINNARQTVTTMIKDVSVANKNDPSEDKEELSRMLVEYLANSLEDSSGNITSLRDRR